MLPHPQPDQHHPPPPINHRTTVHLLKHTTSIFTSHLLTFLLLSCLIFTFRSNVLKGTRLLTSFVDHDPSLKSLLSRVDLTHPQPHPRRRRPFLHISRVGTLDDDDFFSGDSESLFHPISRHPPNSTYLNLGFSQPVLDNGISLPQIVRHGVVSFRFPPEISNGLNESVSDEAKDDNSVVDLKFLIKGLEMGRQEATTLMVLVGILSAAYGYLITSFLVTYSWAHGIVFQQVLDDVLGKYRPIYRTVWVGAKLGTRLSGFVLMRWAVRDTLAQAMGIWFFGEIEDQYVFFKVFLRMKLMPFSDMYPWVKGYRSESLGFMLSWFLVELVLGIIFALDSWIAMVNSRKTGREILKEGCNLLATMLYPAIGIKFCEVMGCSSFTRWILSGIFGELFSLAFQSAMEVYFMVAWLLFYLASSHKEAESLGRTFGRRELEGILEGVR